MNSRLCLLTILALWCTLFTAVSGASSQLNPRSSTLINNDSKRDSIRRQISHPESPLINSLLKHFLETSSSDGRDQDGDAAADDLLYYANLLHETAQNLTKLPSDYSDNDNSTNDDAEKSRLLLSEHRRLERRPLVAITSAELLEYFHAAADGFNVEREAVEA